jgi:HSP20 family protein
MFVTSLRYPLPRYAFHPAWSRSLQRPADADVAERPAMDVAETDTGYTLSFDLPGMAKEQVKVTIDGRVVKVEASVAADQPVAQDARLIHRERRVPHFARTVSLPSELDATASQARFDNGVLTLTLVRKQVEGAQTLVVQ